MLRVIKTGTGDAPTFFCNHCHQPIKDTEMALYTWKKRDTIRWDGKESEFVSNQFYLSLFTIIPIISEPRL